MANGDPKTYAKAKELAASVNGGEPMAWKEYPDGSMVVILQDGRKVTFEPQAKPEPETELSLDTPAPQAVVSTPSKKRKDKSK